MAINYTESDDTKKRREYLESLSTSKPTTGYVESDATKNWKNYLQGLNTSKPSQSYVASDSVTKSKEYLENLNGTKPSDYQSDYSQAAKDAMNTLLNRKDFQYDVNEDALYQQMKDNYIQQGKLAMQDTMGQAAAMTGGYGNSYAQSVGQQAYNGYLQQLNDNLPEYYQMALNAYNAEGDKLKEQYSLLANQEAQDYSRYQDTLDRWNTEYQNAQNAYENERNWDYSQFQDAWNRWNTEYQNAQNSYESERNWDYNQYQDAWNRWNTEYQNAQNAYETGRSWDYGVTQDNATLAQTQVNYLISQGITPNAELLAAAGYDQQYIDQVIKANTAVYTPTYSGSGSSSSNKSSTDTVTAQNLTEMYNTLKASGATQDELNEFTMRANADYHQAANEAFNSNKTTTTTSGIGGGGITQAYFGSGSLGDGGSVQKKKKNSK